MPTLNDIVESVRPVIEQQMAEVALTERLRTLEEIRRYAVRVGDAESVVWWCGLNIDLIKATENL